MQDLELLAQFYSQLQDEESRKLFELKWGMLTGTRKGTEFLDYIDGLDYEWSLSEYDDFRKICGDKEIIVFGAGIDGESTYRLLKKLNIDIFAFCDNNVDKQKSGFLGKQVFSIHDVMCFHRDKFYILASKKYASQFCSQLLGSGSIPRENIWFPRIGSLYATCGKQYFDCPELTPNGEDVFLDCGCFDGATVQEFIEWCGGKYKGVIAFEPDEVCYKECKKLEEEYDHVKIYNVATFDKQTELYFDITSDGGSKNSSVGKVKVQADSIDHILNGEYVSFIKLDIEGAEYNTIMGAKETIIKHKPRMAISLYHKPSDIYEIPTLLMKLRDDYKFYIRHYTNCMWETVLYAI